MLLLVAIAMVSTLLTYALSFKATCQKLAPTWCPHENPNLCDMRTITHSIQCNEQCYDPYITSKCDPSTNYPRIWLELRNFVGRWKNKPSRTLRRRAFSCYLANDQQIEKLDRQLYLRGLLLITPGTPRNRTRKHRFSLECYLFYFCNPVWRHPGFVRGGVVV